MYADARRGPIAPADPGTGASPVILWAFYAFVATLPFEWPNRTIPVETTTLAGAVFLLAALLQPQVTFRRPPLVAWLFAIYLYAMLTAFVLNGAEYAAETIESVIKRLQLVLVFLVGFNLMRDPRVARKALIVLGLACAVLALLTLSGAVSMASAVDEARRVTAFGQNPNRAARIHTGGLLALLGLAYGGASPTLRPRLLALATAGLIGAAILDTGSRGGLLALAAGLWALTLSGRGVGIRLRNIIVSIVGIVVLTWAALQSPMMRRRIELAQAGDFAGREDIFPIAWRLFLERPIVGWGPAQNTYELGLRLADGVHMSRDTHNLLLELLTSTGVLGTLPFLAAFAVCLVTAWRARHGPLGIVPFAIVLAQIAGNVSGNYVALKLTWFALALALASGRLLASGIPAAAAAPTPIRPRWRTGVLRPSP